MGRGTRLATRGLRSPSSTPCDASPSSASQPKKARTADNSRDAEALARPPTRLWPRKARMSCSFTSAKVEGEIASPRCCSRKAISRCTAATSARTVCADLRRLAASHCSQRAASACAPCDWPSVSQAAPGLSRETPHRQERREALTHGRFQKRAPRASRAQAARRSEEHTSELQSLMRISYAVFCLKKKKPTQPP